MMILKKKRFTIAMLSSLLVFGASMNIGVNLVAKAAAKTTIVNVALKPTNEADLTNYVYNTVDPTSAQFHQYLTPAAFASKFGQSDSYIQSFKDYFKKYHVKATAYPGNMSLKLTATTTNMRQAFGAKDVPAAKKGYPSRTHYKLPGNLSSKVAAVVGLYAPQAKKATKETTKKAHTALTADLPTTATKPDTTLAGNAFSRKYGAAKFANAYQLNTLYNKGQQGQGQRIGIISYGDIHNSDLTTYWQQCGVNDDVSRIHRIYTVGTKADAQKSLNEMLNSVQTEATVDVQSASSVAPQADIDFYVGDTTGTRTSDAGAYYTSFMTAISGNQDKQISTSFAPDEENAADWSDPSTSVQQYSNAFNLMLEQAAAQGITVFKSSGDFGRTDQPGPKEIHSMSTSPYLVMVGGTTLPYQKVINNKLISIPTERAWGNAEATSASDTKYGIFGASGGGFSAVNPTPRYQQGISGVNTYRAVTYLTYDKKQHKFVITKHPRVITGIGNSRNLPDVSGNADIQTGYATYVSGTVISVKGTGKHRKVIRTPSKQWSVSGGTSYTSPQMAGANAVMNSGRQTPVGFWNPQIYQFAQQTDSPFTVLDGTENNNLYYTGQPGMLYNQATGLGTINFEKLNEKFDSE
ncbi:S53 family peptidase [Lentilactobacillus sp. G22-6]|uniref:S53 family peptidase n=1 Tax=Lentilactobacillus dabitei TaxID=2831523 RepID=UPI001C262E1D|nr:S53 family peptidase [Lentilactobacillus dabitei]MBU9789328.1 S53 family peptidase [Lentilactobacillus dabitei]